MSKRPANPIVTAIYKHWFGNEYTSVVAKAMFKAALRAKK